MYGVVNEGGTGGAARLLVPGVAIAAKTGTAQVPQDGFSPDRIEAMDLDDIATGVPDSVLRRLSGQ